MKLTGKLKEQVEAAQDMEAKKNIIAEAGMELTDDELAGVTGGAIPFPKRCLSVKPCPYCKKQIKHDKVSGKLYEMDEKTPHVC